MKEKDSFFDQIRAQVAKIPKGRVSTYGEIARSIGSRDARKVGWAVYGNKDPKIPCHRVVAKDGNLSEKFSFGGYLMQKQMLEAEGIIFNDEKKVDMEKYGFSF